MSVLLLSAHELHYINILVMETFSALLAFCVRNSPVTGEFPLQSQWRGALMYSLICAWINSWANNGDTGDLRCHYTLLSLHCNEKLLNSLLTWHLIAFIVQQLSENSENSGCLWPLKLKALGYFRTKSYSWVISGSIWHLIWYWMSPLAVLIWSET